MLLFGCCYLLTFIFTLFKRFRFIPRTEYFLYPPLSDLVEMIVATGLTIILEPSSGLLLDETNLPTERLD